jgi:hypothetical protein
VAKADATTADTRDDGGAAGDDGVQAAAPAAGDASAQSIAVVQRSSGKEPDSVNEPESGDNTSTAAITVVDITSR